jgi:hypothetical protein
MSALDAVSAVWTRLKTVDGVGPNVYNMLRQATTDAAFKQIFVDASTNPAQPIVRAWRVTRVGTAGKDEELQAMSRTHNVEVSGFMSFQDGVSEPIFQQVIENISDAFDPLDGGSNLRRFVSAQYPQGQFDWSGPFQIVGPRVGTLSSVVVHSVVMNYPVREFPL